MRQSNQILLDWKSTLIVSVWYIWQMLVKWNIFSTQKMKMLLNETRDLDGKKWKKKKGFNIHSNSLRSQFIILMLYFYLFTMFSILSFVLVFFPSLSLFFARYRPLSLSFHWLCIISHLIGLVSSVKTKCETWWVFSKRTPNRLAQTQEFWKKRKTQMRSHWWNKLVKKPHESDLFTKISLDLKILLKTSEIWQFSPK